MIQINPADAEAVGMLSNVSLGSQLLWKFLFFDLMNSESVESFQREAVNPAFVKMHLEVIPAKSVLDILCKFLLRIFRFYTK